MATRKQREAGRKGLKAQKKVGKWLEQHKFQNIRPKHPGPWDFTARKGKKKYVIEVKSGDNPGINLSNFKKMLKEPVNIIGLALVIKNEVHLLQYKKKTLAGNRASKTKGKRVEKVAGKNRDSGGRFDLAGPPLSFCRPAQRHPGHPRDRQSV